MGTPSLEAAGVVVDRTPYTLSFEDTIAYLAAKLPSYDIAVACQNVADLAPALEGLHLRPVSVAYDPLSAHPAPRKIGNGRSPMRSPPGHHPRARPACFEVSCRAALSRPRTAARTTGGAST